MVKYNNNNNNNNNNNVIILYHLQFLKLYNDSVYVLILPEDGYK